jgi:hemin uptake protein HemP
MNTEKKAPATEKPVPTYQSRELFQGGKVVLIVHEGREYWLRITSAGKLILTA